jgi:hypothetical protein
MLPNGALGAWCRLRYRHGGVMELHGLRREDAVALRRAADGWVVEAMSDDVLGATAMPTATWRSSSRSADARDAPQGVTGCYSEQRDLLGIQLGQLEPDHHLGHVHPHLAQH